MPLGEDFRNPGSDRADDSEDAQSRLLRLEERFDNASDKGFRARATSEYRRMKAWIGDGIDWNTANILDFGCGSGIAAASIALRHPGATVVGVDVTSIPLGALTATLRTQSDLVIPPNVSLVELTDNELPPGPDYDLIFAWSVLEQVRKDSLGPTLDKLRKRLVKGGYLFVVCDPLYYSPAGANLARYFQDPWRHLGVSVSALRDCVISDTAQTPDIRAWELFIELNRLTADGIMTHIEASGFKTLRKQLFKTEHEPADALKAIYTMDALTTSGFQALYT